ncbi:related to cytoskeleton assembly control protein Sla2 [Saccharomycodes ludwigii]|uniref:Related to cytoskeleton assembly control protein Sla2 n=1 Tax=Saccharomycodes ludwigii TaxID=36035 RepID=A0A376B254_9ASCO|nr:related to cytoskeleton assembly control protein Sla2 [Saccharomycodes ludwigii]
MSRLEPDLEKAIKKACSPDESAPKRKHVRTCIVYTWDHKSAKAFFKILKQQPFSENGDEVQLFKALITLHKVLQEGHKSALIEGIRNMEWLRNLGRIYGGQGIYGRLISEYIHFLLMKLQFHRTHDGFNGTFEYEEYVSLVTVSNPDEGYETILDLMNLQDSLFDFEKTIFGAIESGRSKHNECKISAFIPLVSESYGIYKFITSMLRAMYQQLGSEEALTPLRERFDSQHYMLFEFYADCSSIKYLTSLITIPRLPVDPPNVFVVDNEQPQLKFEPKEKSISPPPSVEPQVASYVIESERNLSPQKTAASNFLSPQLTSGYALPPAMAVQPTGADFWVAQQKQFEQEQQRLEQERQRQLLLQQQQQAIFQEQQRKLESEKQQQQQQMLLQQQQTQNAHLSSMQNDLLTLKNQYDQDQQLLQQYDQRVAQLETEINDINQNASQQIANKDQQLSNIQDQFNQWKNKYESLAKLYSQLRQEHLQLLTKFKKLQQKAASAQEAVEKREKLERDLKSKNIELADLIRERDRARLDADKIKGSKDNEIDQLSIQVRELKRKLQDIENSHAQNLSKIFKQHEAELQNYQDKLANSTVDAHASGELLQLRRQIQDKEEEMEIVQQTMDETLKELAEQQKENDHALDEQIDEVLKANLKKLTDIVDAILLSGMKTIQDSVFQLQSATQAGNANASPNYVLSLLEKASDEATNFANSFNNFIADGPNGDHSSIISSVSEFSSAISELVLNCKGLNRLLDLNKVDGFLQLIARVAREAEYFLEDLLSDALEGKSDEEKTDIVINGNVDMQEKLKELTDTIDSLSPNSKMNMNGDVASVVDREMKQTQQTIIDASQYIPHLLATGNFSGELEVNKDILNNALDIIQAILKLIKSSIACQNEIVGEGKGHDSRSAFYKKNNRWTEGLISAAKSVAHSTRNLITMADGLLNNKNSFEEFIVASNDVAASTVQLVAASRVKSSLHSKTQMVLEDDSKNVNHCCKKLGEHIQNLINKRHVSEKDVDFSKLSIHENKTTELNQQVEILKLENALERARKRLGDIRKYSYRDNEDEYVITN